LESKVEDYYEEMKKYDPEFVEAELKETVLVTDFE
jgi:hypothetical protein